MMPAKVIVDSTLSFRQGNRSIEQFQKDLEAGLKVENEIVEKIRSLFSGVSCKITQVPVGVSAEPDLVVELEDGQKIIIEIQTATHAQEHRYFHVKKAKIEKLQSFVNGKDTVLFVQHFQNTNKLFFLNLNTFDRYPTVNPYCMQFKPSYKVDLHLGLQKEFNLQNLNITPDWMK